MNKKIFTGLVLLMGISITGIIGVQLIWINNAIKVKNELFNRSVNEALTNTVAKLENIHNFGVVNDLVFNDSIHWQQLNKHEQNFVFDTDEDIVVRNRELHSTEHKPRGKTPRPMRIIREFDKKGNNAVIEIKVDDDSSKTNNTFSYQITTRAHTEPGRIIFDGRQNKSNDVVIIKKDTLITDVDSLYTVSMIKIDSVLSSIDSVHFLRPDISKRMQIKAGKLKNIANQAIHEIYAWDVNEIDDSLVNKVLHQELVNKDIPIEFKSGIIRDSILTTKLSERDSVEITNSEYRVELYPNDIFQKNLKLAVFFPEKESFIYRSLNWLLVASFLFSLFILITFALSIFYILRQKKISEMKTDFINNMTHEFKTPIATISVAADSITNEKVLNNPERLTYFAGMIKKENTRMNRQVEDILTIARLDRKDFDFKWEAIDVHDLISDAVQGIELQINKRGGTIELQLDAANPVVTTDKNHCTNVIYNLLDNANKYSAEKPQIRIATQNLAKGILISVEDKGIGMNKAVQSKVFERFYRQTSGNIHNVKGFGLGLSYVKAVVEANRGEISVSSEPGKGSKFDVFLPFVRE